MSFNCKIFFTEIIKILFQKKKDYWMRDYVGNEMLSILSLTKGTCHNLEAGVFANAEIFRTLKLIKSL